MIVKLRARRKSSERLQKALKGIIDCFGLLDHLLFLRSFRIAVELRPGLSFSERKVEKKEEIRRGGGGEEEGKGRRR